MNFVDLLRPPTQVLWDTITGEVARDLAWTFLRFSLYSLIAFFLGRIIPGVIRFFVQRSFPENIFKLYQNLVDPVAPAFRNAISFVLLTVAFDVLKDYRFLYSILNPLSDLVMTISMAWLISRIFNQFFRKYGLNALNRIGRQADEISMVLETVVNLLIGLIAILAYSQSQNFNLIGLLASLGIGGLAVAFAAQKILEQLLSTIVLYLDKPFTPGDYIRLSDDLMGRVESIGLRSTKVRISGKSTLMVIPNSDLINTRIENITCAKKVMVMLYMNFAYPLQEQEVALVSQAVKNSTNTILGIDPGSTDIALIRDRYNNLNRARVTFFILGSGDSSVEFRKQLLNLANERISKQLSSFGISIEIEEPIAYVDSPVTL